MRIPSLTRLRHIFERLMATGKTVTCPCCETSARRFFPAGVANKRLRVRCAYCGSLERHRLIPLLASLSSQKTGARLLCIAPESPLLAYFARTLQASITTADLYDRNVDVQADITALPFPSASFDVVVANHVLEHVPNDTAAMQELFRVLVPGGIAILQTPVDWNRSATDEDPCAHPSERLRRFGQEDHVRLYGRDFVDRLRSVGFTVQAAEVAKRFSQEERNRYGLDPSEIFFQIERPLLQQK